MKKYYLDDKNKLYRLIIQRKDVNYKSKFKILKDENDQSYILFKIPCIFDILEYLKKLHASAGHRGVSCLRNLIFEKNIYIDGLTFLIDYVSKNCNIYVQKNKNNIKREPCTQIITYYPKQRFCYGSN